MTRPKLLWTLAEMIEESPEIGDALRRFADVDVEAMDRPTLLDRLGDYDILVPRLGHTIDEEVLAAGTRLRVIGTPSTGTDHIDVAGAERRGIPVISLKYERAFLDTVQATAEHTWMLILACQRRLREAINAIEQRQWTEVDLRGHELIDRTLGIVGYGRLGTMVSRFARAFGMHVLAADPTPVNDPWVRQLPLDELLEQADIVTLHVHLTDETRHLIGPEQFARLKPGACLVNTSRGDIVDEAAMLEALESGRLAAAGLDVVSEERSEILFDRPLLRYAREHPNVILTPHIGGRTFESQRKAGVHIAGKLEQAWAEVAEARPAH